VGQIGIAASSPEYYWTEEARRIHQNLEKNEKLLKELFYSSEPKKQLTALVLLSPYVWEGTDRFAPEKKIPSLQNSGGLIIHSIFAEVLSSQKI
jgi:hypothetical protein